MSLAQDGYTVVRRGLSHRALSGVSAVLGDVLARTGKKTPGTLDELIVAREAEDHALIYSASCFVGSSIAAYRLINEIAPEVERLTGHRDLHVTPLTVAVQLPGDSRFDYAWHQESAFYPWADKIINVWVPLHRPTRAETGTLVVIPGSHHGGERRARSYYSHGSFIQLEPDCTAEESARQLPMELDLGDYVVFSDNLMHRTAANMGDLPRLVAIMRFIPASEIPNPRPLYKAVSYETSATA